MSLKIIWANNASTKITKELFENDEIITVENPIRFPNPIFGQEYFLITIEHPITHDFEICKVTKVDGNNFYVERAQENTTAKTFPSGSLIENRVTKGTLELLLNSGGESSLPTERKENQSLIVNKDKTVKFEYGQNIYTFEINQLEILYNKLNSILENKFNLINIAFTNAKDVDDFFDLIEDDNNINFFTKFSDFVENLLESMKAMFSYLLPDDNMYDFSDDTNIINLMSTLFNIDINIIKNYKTYFDFISDLKNINISNFISINDINIANKFLNDYWNGNTVTKNQLQILISVIKTLLKIYLFFVIYLSLQNNNMDEIYIYNFLNLLNPIFYNMAPY